MKNLSERLIDLLGAQVDDSRFRELAKELGEQPKSPAPSFIFGKAGFTITATKGIFTSILFHIRTNAVESGRVRAYGEHLPAGIDVQDQKEDIAAKIGCRPFRAEEYPGAAPGDYQLWEHYVIGSRILVVVSSKGNDVVRAIILKLGEEDRVAERGPMVVERQRTKRRPSSRHHA